MGVTNKTMQRQKLLLLLFISASAQAKLLEGDCETDFRGLWPPEVKDKDLKWIANFKEDGSAPRYRLFTTQDVRVVEPNLAYHFELKSLSSSEGNLKQFLISINPDSERLDENCLSEGTLESLSDKSQHTSYSCFKYLVNRPEKEGVWEGGNVGSTVETTTVPFAWKTPKCGCFVINAEVLDENNNIYTHEDDVFEGLKLKACVASMHQNTLEIQSDRPNKKVRNKGKNLKKRLKKKGKKHQRRRGKKFCCKKGIQSHLEVSQDQASPECSQPDASIIEKALETFGFNQQMCQKVYETCCNDKIVGLETFQKMKSKVKKAKKNYRKIRQKLKEKQQPRRV